MKQIYLKYLPNYTGKKDNLLFFNFGIVTEKLIFFCYISNKCIKYQL